MHLSNLLQFQNDPVELQKYAYLPIQKPAVLPDAGHKNLCFPVPLIFSTPVDLFFVTLFHMIIKKDFLCLPHFLFKH